ncbi:MAG: ADP-ribosylglycohydrolase [Clostridia bacterium]|nr:ADP-ribosylglycohydrolase [Clostridia bacterium]
MIESKNGIVGLAIADAMGVPVESCLREELINNPVTKMIGYGTYNVPKGAFSDDTSMTLATIDSIATLGYILPSNIADNFIDWLNNGKYTSTGETFGESRITMRALAKYSRKLVKAEEAGEAGELDNDNSSIMRMLPIAYYCYSESKDEDEIFRIVKRVSSITNRNDISILGCYIYVLYAIELIKGESKQKAYEKIQKANYTFFEQDTIDKYYRILKNDISKYPLDLIKSTSYIVHTLETVLWVLLNTNSYNEAVIGSINLGCDTDTIGACTGGLAGIIYGIDNINYEWIEDLLQYEYIVRLCDKFDKLLNEEDN